MLYLQLWTDRERGRQGWGRERETQSESEREGEEEEEDEEEGDRIKRPASAQGGTAMAARNTNRQQCTQE